MNKDQLLLAINQDFIDAMIPLTKIQTQADKEKYPGFSIGYTCEEWKSEFPKLDVAKIFFTPDDAMAGVVYYDQEKSILLDTYIFGRNKPSFGGKQSLEERLIDQIQLFESLYAEKDWYKLVSPHRGGTAFHLMKNILKREDVSAALYQFFIDFYSHEDYGTSSLEPEILEKVWLSKDKEQKEKTAQALAGYDDVLQVYRGEADRSTPYNEAFSWTLDLNTAYFFASRYGDAGFRILTAKVNKEDIIEYITQGSEEEILVHPNKVFDVTETILPPLEAIAVHYTQDKRFSDLLAKYLLMLKYIVPDNFPQSDIHQKGHVSRVLFWSLVLAKNEKLNKEDTETLCKAVIFHDCGRNNDQEDESHGAKSAQIFKKVMGADQEAEFLITYHSVEDSKAKRNLVAFSQKRKSKVWKMYCILKDADALDRVRLGLHCLDVSYLRTPTASRYVAAARQLLQQDLFQFIQ